MIKLLNDYKCKGVSMLNATVPDYVPITVRIIVIALLIGFAIYNIVELSDKFF